jgi:hypothetical protein
VIYHHYSPPIRFNCIMYYHHLPPYYYKTVHYTTTKRLWLTMFYHVSTILLLVSLQLNSYCCWSIYFIALLQQFAITTIICSNPTRQLLWDSHRNIWFSTTRYIPLHNSHYCWLNLQIPISPWIADHTLFTVVRCITSIHVISLNYTTTISPIYLHYATILVG